MLLIRLKIVVIVERDETRLKVCCECWGVVVVSCSNCGECALNVRSVPSECTSVG